MAIEIRVETLRDGARNGEDTLGEAFAAERLGPDFSVQRPFVVRWHAQMIHNVIELRASIEGAFGFGCSRCGDPLTLPMAVSVHHHWLPQAELEGGEDDPDVSAHDGVAVDVEPVVLDALLVEVPYAPGCIDASEGKCDRWDDAPIVYHAGGPPPDVVETHRPFADLLRNVAMPADSDPPAEG